MIVKEIVHDNNARLKLLEGAEICAKTVTATLGGKGKVVVIQGKQKEDPPHTTKDGVTVANAIRLWDNLLDQGVHLMQQVARKTNADAGDGTTSSILLTYELMKEGIRESSNKTNTAEFAKGMRYAAGKAVEWIEDKRRPVDVETIKHVATVSANNDKALGELIGDTVWKVGVNGSVHVERAGGYESTVEFMTGNILESGLLHPVFGYMDGVWKADDVLVFVSDLALTKAEDVLPMLTMASNEKKPLVIIGGSLDGEAAKLVLKNFTERKVNVVYIEAPYENVPRYHALQDLATHVNGTYFNEKAGASVKDLQRGNVKLGRCKQVVITDTISKFIGGECEPEVMKEYVTGIEKEIESFTNDLKKEAYKSRLSRLQGKVALIKVGGHSKLEVDERFDRIEDSVNASRAALESGTIAGGGVAYLYASQMIENELLGKRDYDLDYRKGIEVVASALEKPIMKNMENALVHNSDAKFKVLKKKVLECRIGYDVMADEMTDMYEQGIIDPVKVIRACIENSVSIASLIMTTDAVIYNFQPKSKA